MAREIKVMLSSPFLGADLAEALWGDMQELYVAKRQVLGFRKAALWYGLQLLGGLWSLCRLSRLSLAEKQLRVPWKKWTVAIIATSLAMALGWLLAVYRPDVPRPAVSQSGKNVVVMIDTSVSVSTPSRAALTGLLKTVLDDRAVLTVTVFTIDSRSAFKPPIAMASFPSFLSPERALFKSGNRQLEIETERKRQTEALLLLHEVGHYLNAKSPPGDSAIYESLQRAVGYLQAHQDGSSRELIVFSDMLENSDPVIERTLREPVGSAIDIGRAIDNRNISVVLYTHTDPRGGYFAKPQRRNEVWAELFSDPGRVKFE